MNISSQQIIITIISTFIAFYTDIKYGKIFNSITFTTTIIGFCLAIYFYGITGLKSSALGLFTGIILYFPLGAFGIVGMGDVKMLGSIGAVCGVDFVLKVFLITSALGFFHALIIQYLNYGKNSFMLLYTSFKNGIFIKKNIFKENASSSSKKYKFLIGIDIFIATIIICCL